MTHFATADDLSDDGFFAGQLAAFTEWARALKAEQPELMVHAANSAAMLRDADAQFDMVRCGIAIYGMDPFGRDPAARGLEPALELSSYVAEVKYCKEGESAGYGRRFVAERDTWIAVLPIGYGDGWRRGLSNNADVLIAGRRYPLVGTVSMDNITVDLGLDSGRRGAARRAGDPHRLPGQRADHRGGGRAATRHDQLRDHLRAHATGAAELPPRRRSDRRRRRDARSRPGGGRSLAMSAGLQAVRTALAGRRAWLVGGVVRDRALGRRRRRGPRRGRRRRSRRRRPRPSPRRPARAACFALSEQFGAWRIVARDRSWQVDVEPLRGETLAADLALRDFTVNAIAEPLDGGEPIDPLGGLADLRARRLRMAGPPAFADDPLRVLRLVRVALELDLQRRRAHPARGACAGAAPARGLLASGCSWSCAA